MRFFSSPFLCGGGYVILDDEINQTDSHWFSQGDYLPATSDISCKLHMHFYALFFIVVYLFLYFLILHKLFVIFTFVLVFCWISQFVLVKMVLSLLKLYVDKEPSMFGLSDLDNFFSCLVFFLVIRASDVR